MQGFHSELNAFIARIERRSKEKLDKLLAEVAHDLTFDVTISKIFFKRPISY